MKKIAYIITLVICFSCTVAKAQTYKTHKVKAGETVESIAKKYKVKKNHILELNPDAKSGIKENAVLVIFKTGGTRPVRGNAKQSPKIPVTQKVTKEIKELTGYKKHRVRRKETLYSLSKKYNVTEAEIKKYNTFLYANNLRRGDKLQIPIFKTVTVVEEKSPTITYTVLPKEGKWRIAYKYGITVSELEALNPDLAAILQPGQVINVPNLEMTSIKEVDAQYSYYKVLPKEGFFRLKIKTGLEKNELEQLNPGLSESGLKEGMILKVPYGSVKSLDENASGTVTNAESDAVNLSNLINDTSTKNVAVMLPFTLNKIDVDSIFDTKQKIKNNRTLNLTLDFYSGVLMAFDSLKKMGLNIKVDVYDTEKSLSRSSSIARNISNTDVVIGPLLSENFNNVASTLQSKNIPIVSPITKKVSLGNNVFQSRPGDDILKMKIIDYFAADTTAQVVIISDVKRKATSEQLKRKFAKASMVSSRLDKKTQKDEYYVLEQDLLDVIKPGKNVVFLETDNKNFVSNVSSMLNALLVDGTEIILTTTNANDAFEHEEVSNYHLSNLHFTFPSISKIIDENVKNSFVENYKKEHKTAPSEFAIRGFDLTMDVVLRMVTSEDLYQSVIDAPMTSYLENKFAYKKKIFGGYYNDSVYLVRYNDLKIEEVKQ